MSRWATAPQQTTLAIAILATFIAFLDGSVVTVALPAIGRELGGGLPAQQWVVDAYLLTLGAVILLAGSLSDLYGRKRVLFWGLIGFGIASALCALAPTAVFLILARVLQGVAGALLVPSSLALIIGAFTGPAQSRAIGVWTGITGLANIAGPVLGGVLVDALSWRWVFGINLLPIAAALLLVRRLPTDEKASARVRIDVLGAVLGILALGLPVFALIESPRFGWGSPVILGALGLGLAAFAGFLARERRASPPMLPLAIFRSRDFSVGNVATAFIYGGVAVGTFSLALFLQQVSGYSATAAGFAMVPSSILLIALAAFFGRLSGKVGPRVLMTAGPIVAGAGFLLMLRIGEHADFLTEVLPAVSAFGLGMAITVAPLTATVLGAVASGRSGIASAVNNAVSRIAGLVAVALAGSVGAATIDLATFHGLATASALALFTGAIVSGIGIRNPATAPIATAGAAAGHTPTAAPAGRR